MIKAHCKILIENFEFGFANSIEIRTNAKTYSDTATIVLPQNMNDINNKISDKINVGSVVQIYLGYDGNLLKEFDGYVKSINPNSPMTIECEDEAFLYKQQPLPGKVYKGATFRSLLTDIYKGELRTTDDKLGDIAIQEGATLIDVLDELAETYEINAYWQNNILYVNYEFEKKPEKTCVFDIQRNVPIGTDNINILKQNDWKPVSHGIIKRSNGTSEHVYASYKDALMNEIIVSQTRPLGAINDFSYTSDTMTIKDMEKYVKIRLKNLYYTGLAGDITTFGIPSLKHGDEANIIDNRMPDRNGVYNITEIVKTFNLTTGYKQKCTIGLKLRDE